MLQAIARQRPPRLTIARVSSLGTGNFRVQSSTRVVSAKVAMSESVVMYHYPCPDGIFSALAAHLHHQQQAKVCRFIALTVFDTTPPEQLGLKGDETVYMCDFAGPVGYAQQVASKCNKLIVLDHHKTAAETLQAPSAQPLPANLEVNIDMARSGATMALDYFQPQMDDSLRQIYRWVEDADLWKWKVAGSDTWHAGLGAMKLEYDVNKNPAIFDTLLALKTEEVQARGKEALEAQARWIEGTVASAYTVQLGGSQDGPAKGWGQCLAVDVDSDMAHHRSKLGNELAVKSKAQGMAGISIVAYVEEAMVDKDTKIKLSLRGVGDDVDTTPITSHYGGGGHRLASSCIVDRSVYNTWKL